MSDLLRITSEIIWHFTCDSCKNWWSISSMDGWKPKQLYCPHCGHKHDFITNNTKEVQGNSLWYVRFAKKLTKILTRQPSTSLDM